MKMTAISNQQLDEGRENWNSRVLSAFREFFTVYGDRRDDREEKLEMMATYGEDAADILCKCGKIISWAAWPEHWREHASSS